MITDKIIIIEDYVTLYQIITLKSDQPHDIDNTLGEDIIHIDKDLFNKEIDQIKKPLFPKGRIQPIIINELTPITYIRIKLRPDHYLYNTTISEVNFHKEIYFDTLNKSLIYEFFNFNKNSIRIRPRITKDEIGIIKNLEKNLEDNLLRDAVLNFMFLPKPPTDIKDLLFARAENAIRNEGDVCAIKYKFIEMRLTTDRALRDLVYIIKNKTNTNKVSDLWNKLRNTNTKDDSKALGSFLRIHSNLILKIIGIENEMNIPLEKRFSSFVKNYIHFNNAVITINYTAPSEIIWYFD